MLAQCCLFGVKSLNFVNKFLFFLVLILRSFFPTYQYRQELVVSISERNLIPKTMFCCKVIAFKKNNAVVHFARSVLHNLTSFAEQTIQIRTKKSSQI